MSVFERYKGEDTMERMEGILVENRVLYISNNARDYIFSYPVGKTSKVLLDIFTFS